jgi:ribose transport system permease protein
MSATTTTTTTATTTSVRARRARSTELIQSYGVLAVLLVVCAVAAFVFPRFATSTNLVAILTAACFVGLITVGQSFVLISGGIDLSVGAVLGLGSVLAALVAPSGWLLALLVPVATGAAIGMLNGLLVGRAKLAPFIVTLAAMLAVQGVAVALAGSSIVIEQSTFTDIGSGSLLGVPTLVWILLAVFAVGALVLNRTRFGADVFAVGGNEDAARMMGVDLARTRILVFVISGALAGLAGALLASYLSSGVATLGRGYELTSIAAAVIGGVLLTGGVGRLLGALGGVLLVQLIENLINQVGTLNAYYQDLATGLFLVVAVVVQGLLTERRRR